MIQTFKNLMSYALCQPVGPVPPPSLPAQNEDGPHITGGREEKDNQPPVLPNPEPAPEPVPDPKFREENEKPISGKGEPALVEDGEMGGGDAEVQAASNPSVIIPVQNSDADASSSGTATPRGTPGVEDYGPLERASTPERLTRNDSGGLRATTALTLKATSKGRHDSIVSLISYDDDHNADTSQIFNKILDASQAKVVQFKKAHTSAFMVAGSQKVDTKRVRSCSSRVQMVVPFVNRFVLERYIAHDVNALRTEVMTNGSEVAACRGAVVFMDVSGFSALAHELANSPTGAEALTKAMNKFFRPLIDLIHEHGGHVIRFVGDALLVFWRSNDPSDEELKKQTLCAAKCAIEVQRWVEVNALTGGSSSPKMSTSRSASMPAAKGSNQSKFKRAASAVVGTSNANSPLNRVHMRSISGQDFSSRMRLSQMIAAGDAYIIFVGPGKRTRYSIERTEVLLTGACLRQLGVTSDYHVKDRIVVSLEAWELLKDDCGGSKNGESYTLYEIDPGAQIGVADPLTLRVPTEDDLDHLFQYVPSPVVEQSMLAINDSTWMSELRNLSILFLVFPELTDFDNRPGEVDLIHDVFVKVGDEVFSHQHDAAMDKMVMDDKGLIMIVVFGFPGMSHENDAERATWCAVKIHQSLRSINVKVSIGVSTGMAFCGCVGVSGVRSDYTVLGDSVNLAARIACMAVPDRDGVRVDEETTRHVAHIAKMRQRVSVDYINPEEVQLKGFDTGQLVFEPCVKKFPEVIRDEEDTQGVIQTHLGNELLFGREEEILLLTDALDNLIQENYPNQCIIIEGDPGLGKTALLRMMKHSVGLSFGVEYLDGKSEQMENTPYYTIRSIFYKMMNIEYCTESERLSALLCMGVDDKIALLNPVFCFEGEDSALTIAMSPEKKLEERHELLYQLMYSTLTKQGLTKIVLLLDDIDNMDADSREAVRYLHKKLCGDELEFIVVATTNPSQRVRDSFHELYDHEDTIIVTLEHLSAEDVVDVAANFLDVEIVPDSLQTFLVEISCGNPMFVEHVLSHLLHESNIMVNKEEGTITSSANEDIEDVDFFQLAPPGTLRGFVRSNMDQLTAELSLALKVASVQGTRIDSRILWKVYPYEITLQKARDLLEALVVKRFLGKLDLNSYTFVNGITQEVAYNCLLNEQLAGIHFAIGLYNEEKLSHKTGHFAAMTRVPQMVYHFEMAQNLAPNNEEYRKKFEEKRKLEQNKGVSTLQKRRSGVV